MEIGVDLVNIVRMKNICEKWKDKFLKRIFSEKELKEIRNKLYPWISLAGKFAAKEAFIKACGSFLGFSWKEIEILNKNSGKPYILLSGKSLENFKKRGYEKILVSISHDFKYAISFVIIL